MAEPRLSFLLGGAQKCGTSALAHYLSGHPGIGLLARKEAHVFDAADFDDAWDTAAVDARLQDRFGDPVSPRLQGDATPITLFHRRFIARVARYNPAMRWIVLLRDPVERAISHHHMERVRGHEDRGLFLAVLAERRRLRGHRDDFSPQSPLRKWSYAARGRYARQLDELFARFPREQVIVLRTQDLAAHPAATTARVLAFLGVSPAERDAMPDRVFEGGYRRPSPYAPGRLLLRWRLRGEVATLRDRHGIDLAGSQPVV